MKCKFVIILIMTSAFLNFIITKFSIQAFGLVLAKESGEFDRAQKSALSLRSFPFSSSCSAKCLALYSNSTHRIWAWSLRGQNKECTFNQTNILTMISVSIASCFFVAASTAAMSFPKLSWDTRRWFSFNHVSLMAACNSLRDQTNNKRSCQCVKLARL